MRHIKHEVCQYLLTKRDMSNNITATFIALLVLLVVSTYSPLAMAGDKTLALKDAVSLALKNDNWLEGSKLREQALNAKSIAAESWQDPKVSLSLANMPTDTWAFDQEPMTQIKVGISQQFERGETQALTRKKFNIQAQQQPLMRLDRRAQLATSVTLAWFDAFLAAKTIHLIETERTLFEQMVDVSQANYSSNVGNTRQQDVIRAQVELIQLDDRLTVQLQQFENAMARLSQWLPEVFLASTNFANEDANQHLSDATKAVLTSSTDYFNEPAQLASLIANHPALLAKNQVVKSSFQDIEIKKQSYKPNFSINASYGLRQDSPTPNPSERADLFSVGISLDVPLFTDNRQDQNVAAAIALNGAIKTDYQLLFRKMSAGLLGELRSLKRMKQRQELYKTQLLVQTRQQAEASLTAYTNDDGDFAEVVQAKITELNARIADLNIQVQIQKCLARLNYFFYQGHE